MCDSHNNNTFNNNNHTLIEDQILPGKVFFSSLVLNTKVKQFFRIDSSKQYWNIKYFRNTNKWQSGWRLRARSHSTSHSTSHSLYLKLLRLKECVSNFCRSKVPFGKLSPACLDIWLRTQLVGDDNEVFSHKLYTFPTCWITFLSCQ